MILIGTSGFSYEDWKGEFYPPRISVKDMLSFYCQVFPAVEINSSYYAIPSPSTTADMAHRTPTDFKFTVKAHKDITHSERADHKVFRAFLSSIEPLKKSGKLGCVIAQYPWSFKPSSSSRTRLAELAEIMNDIPTVVEFRSSLWANEETLDMLRDLGLGFCCVDAPELKELMPRMCAASSNIGYVRFHGRNSQKWWLHDKTWERYDYLYSEDELAEWIPRITALANKTESVYVFFNNHYQGKSAQNARMLARMLSIPVVEPPKPDQLSLFG